MSIKKGSKFYVRVDYGIEDKIATDKDFQDHLLYVKNIAKKHYFIGGGFSNCDGGMIVLEAECYEEAKKIFMSDPIIERGICRFDIFIWDIVVLSKDLEE